MLRSPTIQMGLCECAMGDLLTSEDPILQPQNMIWTCVLRSHEARPRLHRPLITSLFLPAINFAHTLDHSASYPMLCVCLVAQSCLTLCNPMDFSLTGSSVCGDCLSKNTRVVAMPSSRGSCQPRDQIQLSCFAGGFFTIWATKIALTLLFWRSKSEIYFLTPLLGCLVI